MPTQQAARDALQKLITRYHAITPLTGWRCACREGVQCGLPGTEC
jgi:hypothetical protein